VEQERRMMEQNEMLRDPATPFGEIDDVVEMRRMSAYFRDLADKNGARLLVAEAAASKYRQLLEQKIRGFSLLSRLSSDVSASEDPPVMARILAGHLNSMLNMNRTVVLASDPEGGGFSVLGCAGYSEADQQRLENLRYDLSKQFTEGHRSVSTRDPLTEDEKRIFGAFDISYFMAIPVMSDDRVMAGIVTGRMREQRPFSPPLEASDLETVSAIGGFFGAYLARHQLIVRDGDQARARLALVEKLVSDRTAEIERQRALLSDALKKLQETQQQLMMRERLAFLGELMAGIAHEIQNPLNFVNNFSEISSELVGEVEEILNGALSAFEPERRQSLNELLMLLRSNVDKVARHGRRVDSIVRNMLLHSRDHSGHIELCDLNAILAETVGFAYSAARGQEPYWTVEITRDFDASLGRQTLAPHEISRVFLNIFGNAFYALRERQSDAGPDYLPTLSITSRRLDGIVEVRLRDNGSGIPDDIRSSLFTPFFSTKPPGEGSGLGLSLSYDIIVNGHGGSIDVESRLGEFTEFIIRLPS